MRIDQISGLIKTLPGMPAAAFRLLAAVDDPAVTIQQIETILRRDPGLTANVLKLANSAYFGIPSKVGSVRQAVVLFGLKRLIHMVVAACTSTILNRTLPGYNLLAGELWRHSLAVSLSAEGLMRELRIPGAQETFTAALLHDVGKIVLGPFVQERRAEMEEALARGISFEMAESAVLGADHAEVGAHVLSKWSFPANTVNAVRWHHAPEQSERVDAMLDVVHTANAICLAAGIDAGSPGLGCRLSEDVTRRLGLDSTQLEKLADQSLKASHELGHALAR